MTLSIRKKTVLFFGGISLLFLAYFVYIYTTGKENFTEEKLNNASQELLLLKTVYENKMESITESFSVLKDTPSVKFLAENNKTDAESSEYDLWFEAASGLFSSYCDRIDTCHELSFLDENGNEMIKVGRTKQGQSVKKTEETELKNVEQEHYFIDTKQLSDNDTYISEMMLGHDMEVVSESYSPIIYLGFSLYDKEGNQTGVVMLTVFADEFIDLISTNNEENYSLMDQDLYYLHSPVPGNSEFEEQLGWENTQAMLFDWEGLYVGISKDDNYVNEFVKIEYDPLDKSKYWIIGKSIKIDEFYLDFTNNEKMALILNLLIITILLLISLLFGENIAKPIEKLSETVGKIKKGNYKIDWPEIGSGEVGDLKETLRELVDKVQHEEKERFNFINSMSHQLPTPIIRIRLQLSVLKDKIKKLNNNEEAMEIFESIQKDNELSVDLTNDILEMIELGNDYHAESMEKINLKEIIIFVDKTFETVKRDKKINLTVKVDEGTEIRGEEERIKSLFFNLISNAITYSNDGGSVVVEAMEESDHVVIKVSDHGIGIPEKDKIHVFGKFIRGQNAYGKKTVGTGLGLTICKMIVEGHDGKIWFESEEGHGSTFFVSLPNKP